MIYFPLICFIPQHLPAQMTYLYTLLGYYTFIITSLTYSIHYTYLTSLLFHLFFTILFPIHVIAFHGSPSYLVHLYIFPGINFTMVGNQRVKRDSDQPSQAQRPSVRRRGLQKGKTLLLFLQRGEAPGKDRCSGIGSHYPRLPL